MMIVLLCCALSLHAADQIIPLLQLERDLNEIKPPVPFPKATILKKRKAPTARKFDPNLTGGIGDSSAKPVEEAPASGSPAAKPTGLMEKLMYGTTQERPADDLFKEEVEQIFDAFEQSATFPPLIPEQEAGTALQGTMEENDDNTTSKVARSVYVKRELHHYIDATSRALYGWLFGKSGLDAVEAQLKTWREAVKKDKQQVAGAQKWIQEQQAEILKYRTLLADLQAKPLEWWAKHLVSVDENLAQYFYAFKPKLIGKISGTLNIIEEFERGRLQRLRKADSAKLADLEKRINKMNALDEEIKKFQAELSSQSVK